MTRGMKGEFCFVEEVAVGKCLIKINFLGDGEGTNISGT